MTDASFTADGRLVYFASETMIGEAKIRAYRFESVGHHFVKPHLWIGHLAEHVAAIMLPQLGVPVEWVGQSLAKHDLVIGDWRIDVKCSLWNRYGVLAVPDYVTRRRVTGVLLSTFEPVAPGGTVRLFGLTRPRLIQTLGRFVGAGESLVSGKPAVYPMWEIPLDSIPRLDDQLTRMVKWNPQVDRKSNAEEEVG